MYNCPVCGVGYERGYGGCCNKKCWFKTDKGLETRIKMSESAEVRVTPPGFGAKMSAALKGKPKPWQRGVNNPNYGNKAQSTPEGRERYLAGMKRRRTDTPARREANKRHSNRMRGEGNPFFGKRHSEASKKLVSETKRTQYSEGRVNLKSIKRSEAEYKIQAYLEQKGVEHVVQFQIPGRRYLYDFCFPDHKIIIEYQGDYWHANPQKHVSGSYLRIQRVGDVLVDDIWARDLAKKQAAEAAGYQVVYVWEIDYKKKGNRMIGRLLKQWL